MTADKSAQIEALRREASGCRACPLWKNATQTVFGEGPVEADILFVGEQPGDREDQAGHPFVGPAGRMLDKALEEAGVDRKRAYVTNAVKHFKFEPRGKLRLHKKPNVGEINVCKRWLFGEIDVLKPRLVVALGATAAQSLRGPRGADRQESGRDAHSGEWTSGVRDRPPLLASPRAGRGGQARRLCAFRGGSPRRRRARGGGRTGRGAAGRRAVRVGIAGHALARGPVKKLPALDPQRGPSSRAVPSSAPPPRRSVAPAPPPCRAC